MSYQNQIDDDLEINKPNESRSLLAISEANIRLGFIRKVYGIILFQLAITTGFTLLMMYTPSMTSWVLNNSWILWVDFVLVFAIMIVISCCHQFARQVPTNYILLIIFTLGFSLLVGLISALTDPSIVLIAFIMTMCVTISLTIYAFVTKTDFTVCGGFLFIFGMILIVFGIFMWWGYSSTANTIYCALAAFFYGLFLIFDTQMLTGKHKLKYAVDEYVFAALNIYIDIIGLFLYILSLLSHK